MVMIRSSVSSKKRGGLDDLIGCTLLKEQIRTVCLSSIRRGDVFPHSILYGLGGTGKTAFALAIGSETDAYTVVSEAATLKTRESVLHCLRSYLREASNREKSLLWVIDEIHRLAPECQESLYYPMKDWLLGGEDIPRWTLIGATTRLNRLDQDSFVTRFIYRWHMERYSDFEIREILAKYFDSEGLSCGPMELTAIGRCSLGVPRVAIRLGDLVRDEVWAHHPDELVVGLRDISNAFNLSGIDNRGLTREHRAYLLKLHASKGSPCGLRTLASKLGMHKDVVEESVEPILLSLGLVDATPRGRLITPEGTLHLSQLGLLKNRGS